MEIDMGDMMKELTEAKATVFILPPKCRVRTIVKKAAGMAACTSMIFLRSGSMGMALIKASQARGRRIWRCMREGIMVFSNVESLSLKRPS